MTKQVFRGRTVQELLSRSDVRRTMIYTHVLNRGPAGVRSPLDGLLTHLRRVVLMPIRMKNAGIHGRLGL